MSQIEFYFLNSTYVLSFFGWYWSIWTRHIKVKACSNISYIRVSTTFFITWEIIVSIFWQNFSRCIIVTLQSALRCHESPVSRLFVQPFVQAHIKENIKAQPHWPLLVNPLVIGGFPSQGASYAENVSIWWHHHLDDDLYTVTPSVLNCRVIREEHRPRN